MKKKKGGFEIRFAYRPWIFFLIFAISSALLSYTHLSILSKLFVGFFGVILPFLLALGTVDSLPKPSTPLYEKESLPVPSVGVWGLVVLAAILLRFYGLTDWALWPNTDEGLIGHFALALDPHWNWRFFYTFGQAPPGMVWLLSPLVSHSSDPLWALWFLPAVLSLMTALLSYWAVRSYLSKSLSFLTFFLFALSFWPVYFGRFCHQGVLLPLWVCLVLGTLGIFLKARSDRQVGTAALLGAVTALGSFAFTSWPVLAFWVWALTVWVCFFRMPKGGRVFGAFAAAFFIVLLPFLTAVVTEGFGQHIYGVSSVRGYVPWSSQVIAFFSYLTAPFWGVLEDHPAYSATWGGMLNPLLTGAFFIGVLESYLNRHRGKIRWAWAGALLCLLPGFFSMNVEMYRVILVMPFLLVGSALGIQRLFSEGPKGKQQMVFLILAVFLSLALDVMNLIQPHLYPLDSPQGALLGAHPGKPIHTYQAYELLKKQSAQGPGLYFNDFEAAPYDQTLMVATYGFNALVNPRVSPEKAQWAAILVNVNNRPFLQKRFPRAQWAWIDSDSESPAGGRMLGIIPIEPENQETFRHWVRVYPFFRDLDWRLLNMSDGVKRKPLAAGFAQVKPLLAGDPFLQECYWEKVEELFHRDREYKDDVESLQKAIQEGYPSAHLYYNLGSIQLRKNEFEKARQSLGLALKAPLNLTQSAAAIAMVNELEKQGGLPQSEGR